MLACLSKVRFELTHKDVYHSQILSLGLGLVLASLSLPEKVRRTVHMRRRRYCKPIIPFHMDSMPVGRGGVWFGSV